ncbi:PQQ-binding-like beta-propeller repeat protein [Prauserella flavalba]|uniref:Rv3212 family protein n=1 Tax=Prauserella flavalba TaxID=1477506 RepID=UPI000D76B5BB|nr:PQQ-binding-like beta-propeller repeat protein [Prauserella flavalba]
MNTSSGRHRRHDDSERHDADPPVLPPGTEDVLAPASEHDTGEAAAAPGGARHAAPPRSRPSPWNRRRDRVAAALITVVVLVAGVLVWAFSDQRATSHELADPPAALPPAPASVPASLQEIWQAESPATPVPVSEDSSVVTGSGGEVTGRDPLTGDVRWRYARDLELCTVAGAWSRALAVYHKDTGCSEVTQLDPSTGRRTAQRNGDAELNTRLVSDGGHVTTTGKHLLNTWRNDLVKSLEYGEVFPKVNPEKQPREGCTYGTVAAGAGEVGVIEDCPGEQNARLTVLKAAGEEADEPEEVFSTVLPDPSAWLVAMSGDTVAVALPQRRQLALYGSKGEQLAAYPLDVPAADLQRAPEGGVVPTAKGADNIYWFTGSSTVALSRKDLTPQWTLDGTRGPGAMFAGQYVVPIEGGLAVVDEGTGSTVRTVGVDRHGYRGQVQLASAGPVLLEQRGGTLVALR